MSTRSTRVKDLQKYYEVLETDAEEYRILQ